MRKTFIIAEAGVNHNGDMRLAERLVDAAKAAGADAVKFQTFNADALVAPDAPKAEYQKKTTAKAESQRDMLKRLELDRQAHFELAERCRACGIEFLSTGFDLESQDFLIREMDLKRIKIPSGEITNGPLLLQAARGSKPIILSTGMTSLAEIEQALAVIAFGCADPKLKPSPDAFEKAYLDPAARDLLKERVTLLHCTTEYPAAFEETNLRVMDTLKAAFGLEVGLSDHTPGIAVPLAAVARGAAVIEKHFTLDKNLPGPDHKASLTPDELATMVAGIRQIELSLGRPEKIPAAGELKNKPVARKSLVAKHAVAAGEIWSEANLTCKRPGTGVSPMLYWHFIGKPAARAYAKDELLQL